MAALLGVVTGRLEDPSCSTDHGSRFLRRCCIKKILMKMHYVEKVVLYRHANFQVKTQKIGAIKMKNSTIIRCYKNDKFKKVPYLLTLS